MNRKGPDMSRLEKLFLINPVPETFLLHYTVNNESKTIRFSLVVLAKYRELLVYYKFLHYSLSGQHTSVFNNNTWLTFQLLGELRDSVS